MNKVLVLGATGMLGHVVYIYLDSLNKYNIINSSFRTKLNDETVVLDLTNPIDLEKYIVSEKPDIIINCVGVLVQGSQNDSSNAIYLNAYLPHLLSKILREYGGKLIHVSTDCVFSGHKGGYLENDIKDATDTYGLSKSLGEVINDIDLTIRTSIIGPELKKKGEGLFHWYMNQEGEIFGYEKMIWGGVTTLELAKAIDSSIDKNITGLVHITNGEPISKFDLLSLFSKIWKTDHIKINAIEGKVADKSLKSIKNNFNYIVPSYEEMLQEMFDWMGTYSNLYLSNYTYLSQLKREE